MAVLKTTNINEHIPASGFKKFWSDYSESPLSVAALIVFLIILFIAIFAPLISPTNPYDLASVDIMNSRLPPGSEDFPAMSLFSAPMALGETCCHLYFTVCGQPWRGCTIRFGGADFWRNNGSLSGLFRWSL